MMGSATLKANSEYVILLILFAFSFIYRIAMMLWQTYPSGADIGLHNSVIHSITQGGNTNFLYNFYQMGGGLSLTFPGYHIFASGIIIMTGMPDYLAQTFIVALFSSLIVLSAYLVTKAAWTESGALIVAFVVAVSRFDIEMLQWGGYPNVITLLLIPVTFYLFLQRGRFSLMPFLISSSVLVGSIFLTHSLSAVVFVGTTAVSVLAIMAFPKLFNTSRKLVFSWLLPIIFGAALVLPFIVSAVPAYLSSNSTFTGVTDIQRALVSTRVISLEIVIPLFAIVGLFFILSKGYKGRYISIPAFLLAMWLLAPLVLTQGYLFGLYIDYNRFLYFLILPVIVLFGMFLDHGANFFAYLIDNYRFLSSQAQKTKKATNKYVTQISRRITRRNLYTGFVTGFLMAALLVFPILLTPWQGVAVGNFYQVMNNPGYEAIHWTKQNTPTNSVFVSDALYGWWFGGFAQRPTISAVDPEYLTASREVNPAKNASLLLDTDYMIDNGYIQVREDGGYIARHNPQILADLNWTYYPYSFFDFDNNQIRISYITNGENYSQSVYLNQLSVKKMTIETNSQSATIIVSKGNDLLNYTQYLTVYQGSAFVNLTATIETTVNGISLDSVSYTVQSKGTIIELNSNSVGWIDVGLKVFGQLIFYGNNASLSKSIENSPPNDIDVTFSLGGKSQGQIQMAAGAYSVTDEPQFYQTQTSIDNYFKPIITTNLNTPQPIANLPVKSLITFDYQKALREYSVSYLANRDSGLDPKFACDPAFSLVFINSEVAIFKVKANTSPTG
jgi:hypothetical protein